MDNTLQNTINEVAPEGANSPAPQQLQSPQDSRKPMGLLATTAICAVLAVAGIAFGVYEFMDSSQKAQRISDLETYIEDKDAKIAELKTEISNLGSETEGTIDEPENINPESGVSEDDETAIITLGEMLSEGENYAVFKIGEEECRADIGLGSPTSLSSFSLKCDVIVNGKNAMIGYNGSENILRLIIYK